MLACPDCHSQIPDSVEKCFTCGFNAGPPNVRTANSQSEAQALEERYRRTLERAETVGSLAVLTRFEEAVKSSCAVINGDLRFLYLFVTSGQNLYANYEGGVAGQVR